MHPLTFPTNTPNGYLSLCYHYIRDSSSQNLFPRILGTSVNEFEKHIEMFSNHFKLITPSDALSFSYGNYNFNDNEIGLLLTFDDGLSDHYTAAKILAKYGIKAIFFIPTCVLKDELPANPIIIHYCIAKFGLSNFLNFLKTSLEKNLKDSNNYLNKFSNVKENYQEVIQKIKYFFKYELNDKLSRIILLEIYEKMFHKKFPDAMEIMHLTKNQVCEIIEMGHSIGTHTHSHISVGSSNLEDNELDFEIIQPKNYIEKTFKIKSDFMSYPFGKTIDCLSSKELIVKTDSYKLAFTVDEILNKKSTSPYELGRYMPSSSDTSDLLYKKMITMVSGK
jgi:peptidoglycan/xylan/chitin deacetylase (PgdA/CDA1 family)